MCIILRNTFTNLRILIRNLNINFPWGLTWFRFLTFILLLFLFDLLILNQIWILIFFISNDRSITGIHHWCLLGCSVHNSFHFCHLRIIIVKFTNCCLLRSSIVNSIHLCHLRSCIVILNLNFFQSCYYRRIIIDLFNFLFLYCILIFI